VTGAVLAFETSSPRGSVALRRGDTVEVEPLGDGLRHGRTLLPAAEACLRRAGIGLRELDAIAVGIGPGSYTGTRIGVMAARALAWGAGVKLVAVSSLAALAHDARGGAPRIVTVRDARRDEVYVAAYRSTDGFAEVPDRALTPEEAAAVAGPGDALVGDGIDRYPEIFAACLAAGARLLTGFPAPTAAAVAALAFPLLAAGRCADPLLLQPEYLRRDEAPPVFERA